VIYRCIFCRPSKLETANRRPRTTAHQEAGYLFHRTLRLNRPVRNTGCIDQHSEIAVANYGSSGGHSLTRLCNAGDVISSFQVPTESLKRRALALHNSAASTLVSTSIVDGQANTGSNLFHLTRKALPSNDCFQSRLAPDGLIKIRSKWSIDANGSRDFCEHFSIYIRIKVNISADVHSICAGRTPFEDNAYILEVLRIASSSVVTKWIVLALTCCYQKEYLTEGSPERKKVADLEIHALNQALRLWWNPPEPARMLMIHYAALNRDKHPVYWIEYLCESEDTGQESSVINASHAVWLMTFLPLTEKYRFQRTDRSWLWTADHNRLTKVIGVMGTSRGMLAL
jgi:hypothetical protein